MIGVSPEVSLTPIAERVADHTDVAISGILQTDGMLAHQNLYTDETVYDKCNDATYIVDPEERINTLQVLMANVVEQELRGSALRVFRYLHQDFELLGPSYYEEHTSQAWRDVAYNGLVAVLASAQGEVSREDDTAHGVINKHAKHRGEFSMGARLQAVHTVVGHHMQAVALEQGTEADFFNFLDGLVNSTARLSMQAKADLYAQTEGIRRLYGWHYNPLRCIYESIKDGEFRLYSTPMKRLCQEAVFAADERGDGTLQIRSIWTPADAAAAMRKIKSSSASESDSAVRQEPQIAKKPFEFTPPWRMSGG